MLNENEKELLSLLISTVSSETLKALDSDSKISISKVFTNLIVSYIGLFEQRDELLDEFYKNAKQFFEMKEVK